MRSLLIYGLVLLTLPAPAQEVTYQDHILPIFRSQCLLCHNADKAKGGLNLSTYGGVMAGGSGGEIVVPQDPDSSRLYRVLAHLEEPFMPKDAAKRPDPELEVVRNWILGGLLNQSGDTAKKSNRPKVDLKLADIPLDELEGDPPLPRDGRLEPYLHTQRPNGVIALRSSPWAPLLAIGGYRQIALYDPLTQDLVDVLPFDDGLPCDITFSLNGSLLLAAGGSGAQLGRIHLWNIEESRQVTVLGDELDTILSADISPDQGMVVLGGSDKRIKVLSTATGEILHNIKKHNEWVTAVAFSPDGVLMASGDRGNGLFIWEVESGQEFHTLTGHGDGITALRWRRDGNVLASASEDGSIKLWDMHKGNQVKDWQAHSGGVLGMAYARDGRLASVGRDKRAVVWDANGGAIREIKDFPDLPTRCDFSQDGTLLAVGDWLGRVTLWKIEDGSQAGEINANPPTLAMRIEDATPPRDAAQAELAAKSQLADAASTEEQALRQSMATASARQQKAQENIAARKQQHEQAKSNLEITRAAMEEATRMRSEADTRVSQLSEAVAALTEKHTAAKARLDSLQAPESTQPMSDESIAPPPPEPQVPSVPSVVSVLSEAQPEPAPNPELESARQELATLDAELTTKQRELVEAQQQLDALTKTQQEREIAVADSTLALEEAANAVPAAEAELAQANDAMPPIQEQVNQAEQKAKEAAALRDEAKQAFETTQAELTRWEAAAAHQTEREARQKAEALQLASAAEPTPEPEPEPTEPAAPPPPAQPAIAVNESGLFATTVKPVFDARCIDCHNPEKLKGKLRLDTAEGIMAGGESGDPAVVPGDPDSSKLMKLISLPADDIDIMPSKGDLLTPEQIETIRAWITAGATFD